MDLFGDEDREDDDDHNDDDDEDHDDDNDEDLDRSARMNELQERFAAQCDALQANDPNEAKVSVFELSGTEAEISVDGYGTRLGNALTGNTHVSSLVLDLSHESIHGGAHDNVGDLHGIAPLLQYLREGTALTEIDVPRGILARTRPFIQAVAQNPNIRKVWLRRGVELPDDELANLFRTGSTVSVTCTSMPMSNSMSLAELLSSNRTLLMAAFFVSDEQPTPNGAILYSLISHPRLTILILFYPYENVSGTALIDVALCDYLKGTVHLKELALYCGTFNPRRIHHLIDGLASNQSIARLRLARCIFNAEALSVLESLVQSTDASITNVREMRVQGSWDDIGQKSLALLVLGSRQLQVFHCLCDDSTVIFWHTLPSYGVRASLREVALDDVSEESFTAIMTCIPKLVYLQKMHLSSFRSDFLLRPTVLRQFYRAVRQSGSLLQLSFGDDINAARFWGTIEGRRIKASLARNNHLSTLLAHPRLDQHDDATATQSTEVSQFPGLFNTAMQAPMQSNTWMLTGLLALNEDDAPRDE